MGKIDEMSYERTWLKENDESVLVSCEGLWKKSYTWVCVRKRHTEA